MSNVGSQIYLKKLARFQSRNRTKWTEEMRVKHSLAAKKAWDTMRINETDKLALDSLRKGPMNRLLMRKKVESTFEFNTPLQAPLEGLKHAG